MKKVIFKNIPKMGVDGVYNFEQDSELESGERGFDYYNSDSIDNDISDKFLNRDLYTSAEDSPINKEILDSNLIMTINSPYNEGSFLTINDLTVKNRGVNHRLRHSFVTVYLFTNHSIGVDPSTLEYQDMLYKLDEKGGTNKRKTFEIYHRGGRKYRRKGGPGQVFDSAQVLKNVTTANTEDLVGSNTIETGWSDFQTMYTKVNQTDGGIVGGENIPTFNPYIAFDTEVDVSTNLIKDDTTIIYMLVHMGGNAKRWGKVKRRKKRINIFSLPITNTTGDFKFKFDTPFHVTTGPGNRTPAFDVKVLDVSLTLTNELFKYDGEAVGVTTRDDIIEPTLLDINRNFEINALKTSVESQVLLNATDYLTDTFNPNFIDDSTVPPFAFGNNWALNVEREAADYSVLTEIKTSGTDKNLQVFHSSENDKLLTSTPNQIELSIDIGSPNLPDFQNEPLRGLEVELNNETIYNEDFKKFYYVVSWNDVNDEMTWDFVNQNAPRDILELTQQQNQNLYIYKFNKEKIKHSYSKPGLKKIKIVVVSYRHIKHYPETEYITDDFIPIIDDYYANGYFNTTNSKYNIIQPIRWKLVTANIFLNKSINEYNDFSQLGGTNFKTIPWPYTTPVIGGLSENSKYIYSLNEALKGNTLNPTEVIEEQDLISAINNDEIGKNIQRLDLEQVRFFNKNYDMSTLLNIGDIDITSNIMIQPKEYFTNGTYDSGEDTTPEYLATLPFPQYAEEFDINDVGTINTADLNMWVGVNRPDIAMLIAYLIIPLFEFPSQYTYPDYIISWDTVDNIPIGMIVKTYNNFNYWDGETPETTFPMESSVGQIFIGDNSNIDLKQNCRLELNTGKLTSKSILDTSGNSNKGLIIGDYKVKKNRKGEPMRRDSFVKVPKKTGNSGGAL